MDNEMILLETFPDDDKYFCKEFWVPQNWLINILESLDSFTERNGVDLERFLQNYIWDETEFIFRQAQVQGVVKNIKQVKPYGL